MEDLFKNTFDKIEMASDTKAKIRNKLSYQCIQRKKYNRISYAAIAVAFIAVLFIAPSTRTAIVKAAEYLTRIFETADGSKVVYEETDNSFKFTIETSDTSYTEISDGRLYFVFGEIREDITDRCSENSYFRYEIDNSDGSRSVILIGGTVTDNGWIELLFDKDGNYVFNKMKVKAYDAGNAPAWINTAMHEEGVPCGDPLPDSELIE